VKYMITWHERSMGSPTDYESAQKRILFVFKQWKFPESLKVLEFVIRVGDWGGYMLVETSDPVSIHKLTTLLPAFEFRVDLVVDIQTAMDTELETMAWRDQLGPG
jgi:hypothetical protein